MRSVPPSFASAISEPWRSLALGAYLYGALLLSWRWTWLLFVLLALGTVVLLSASPTRRTVILWGLSTAAGLLGERWMTQHHIWIYARPDVGGLPIWLFWIWGYLMVTFTRLAVWGHQRLHLALAAQPGLRRALKYLALAGVVGYGAVVASTVAPVFTGFYVVFGLGACVYARGGFTLMLFWVAALLGLIGEASAIAAGVWTYTRPFFTQWGIPISMPLAWGLSAVILHHLSGAWVRPRQTTATADTRQSAGQAREAIFLIGCALYMYTVAIGLWRFGMLLTGLLTLSWLAILLYRFSPRNALLSLLGLAIGVGLEALAVMRFHLWAYAQPDWGGLPTWIVPGIHGSMPVLLVRAAECVHAWAHGQPFLERRHLRLGLWWAGYLGCLGYWLLVMAHVASPIATVSLVVGAVVFFYPCSGRDLVLFWLAATVAPVMEYGGIHAGIWTYTNPFFAGAGIPISLPLSWGFATLIGCRLSETAMRRWKTAGHASC